MDKLTEQAKESFLDVVKGCFDEIYRRGYEQGINDGCGRWRSTEELPPDGEVVVVETKGGARYFSRPINGKWLKDVERWCMLPSSPSVKQ